MKCPFCTVDAQEIFTIFKVQVANHATTRVAFMGAMTLIAELVPLLPDEAMPLIAAFVESNRRNLGENIT